MNPIKPDGNKKLSPWVKMFGRDIAWGGSLEIAHRGAKLPEEILLLRGTGNLGSELRQATKILLYLPLRPAKDLMWAGNDRNHDFKPRSLQWPCLRTATICRSIFVALSLSMSRSRVHGMRRERNTRSVICGVQSNATVEARQSFTAF